MSPLSNGRNECEQTLLDFDAGGAPGGRGGVVRKTGKNAILLTISEIPVTMPEWSNATPQRPPAGTAAGAGPLRTGRNGTAANALKTNDPAKWLISRPNDFNGLQTPSRNRSLRLRNEGFSFWPFWPLPGSMRNDRPRLRPAAANCGRGVIASRAAASAGAPCFLPDEAKNLRNSQAPPLFREKLGSVSMRSSPPIPVCSRCDSPSFWRQPRPSRHGHQK